MVTLILVEAAIREEIIGLDNNGAIVMDEIIEVDAVVVAQEDHSEEEVLMAGEFYPLHLTRGTFLNSILHANFATSMVMMREFVHSVTMLHTSHILNVMSWTRVLQTT